MRVILFILILAVGVLLAAVATGLVGIHEKPGAGAGEISANGVAADGHSPRFEIETGSLAVGSKRANVAVPIVKVVPPKNNNAVNKAG